jgi:hypothetical protein
VVAARSIEHNEIAGFQRPKDRAGDVDLFDSVAVWLWIAEVCGILGLENRVW